MVCLLLFFNVKFSLHHLIVGACSVAPIQYGPSRNRSGGHGLVCGPFAVFTVSRPVVSWPVGISNLQPILVYNPFPKSRIALLRASPVSHSAVCIHVGRNYCASSLSDGSLPVQLPRLSLSCLYMSSIVHIDNPRHLFSSSFLIGHHDIVVRATF